MTHHNNIIVAINEGFNSSVVISNGENILFACENERVTGQKNTFGLPTCSVRHGLSYCGIDPAEVTTLLLSNMDSPIGSKAAFLHSYDLAYDADKDLFQGPKSYVAGLLKGTTTRRRRIQANDALKAFQRDTGLINAVIHRSPHHLNHAASAYFGLLDASARKQPTLIVTLDGGGDDVCAGVYLATNGDIKTIAETPTGHSLGNIFARVTHHLGFRPHEHEYKLMGLAPYARTEYYKDALDVFRGYLGLDPSDPLRFKRLISEPTNRIGPRLKRDLRRQRFDAVAAALQAFSENLILEWLRAVIRETGIKRVVAAGGSFMNVKSNLRIARELDLELFDVLPSCGDETLPFGHLWQHLNKSHDAQLDKTFNIYTGDDIRRDIEDAIAYYRDSIDVEKCADATITAAQLIADGEIIAWCQGRMEFGARALGNRSILASAYNMSTVHKINRSIKRRDFWMPFAPAICIEDAPDYLRIPRCLPPQRISAWMMHSFDTHDHIDNIDATVHPFDRTARAQIVNADIAPKFHRLISKYKETSGCAVLLNTSFNLHGTPLVRDAKTAISTFLKTDLDVLFCDDWCIRKKPRA